MTVEKRNQTLGPDIQKSIKRLQAQVMRLEKEIQKLKRNGNAQKGPKKPQWKNPILAHEIGPPLPEANGEDLYPALEALDVILARQILHRRLAIGWSQAELAEKSGVRPETISRLETGKNAPNVS